MRDSSRPGQAQVVEGFLVHGEEAHGGTVFGSHVGYGRPVRQAHVTQAGTVELDELPDDALFAEHFRDGESQVGGRRPVGELAGQFEPDHFRHHEVKGLPQHAGFRLNAADTPADDAQTVDHRRVGVGAHQRIREDLGFAVLLLGHGHLGQVFQVDLVDDPRRGRNDPEVVEGFLGPAEQAVTLLVPFKFHVHVVLQGIRRAKPVHHHGVVDDEIDGNQGVDPLRIAADPGHRGPQSGEVHHRRNAGEVLKDDPCRFKGNFLLHPLIRPTGQHADMLGGNRFAVVLPGGRFQQHLDGEGQAGDVSETLLFQPLQAPVNISAAIHVQGGADVEPIISVCHGVYLLCRWVGKQKEREPFVPLYETKFLFSIPIIQWIAAVV